MWSSRSETVTVTYQAPFATAEQLGTWLLHRLARPIHLVLTNNRTHMMTFREEEAAVHLRLHRFFLNADAAVLEALARYVETGGRDGGRAVDMFIEEQAEQLELEPAPVRTAGRFHDLTEILSDLNAKFFHDACAARITWGNAGTRRYRRSIQLGSYVSQERLIRIHPCLDQAFVPRAYVAWVVFHEMLHEVFGTERDGGRRSLHPPEFGVLEETFPGYRDCKKWETENLHRLLRYRPERKRRRKPSARR